MHYHCLCCNSNVNDEENILVFHVNALIFNHNRFFCHLKLTHCLCWNNYHLCYPYTCVFYIMAFIKIFFFATWTWLVIFGRIIIFCVILLFLCLFLLVILFKTCSDLISSGLASSVKYLFHLLLNCFFVR